MRYERPRPIAAADNVGAFSCGDRSLDDWLKRRAVANEATGASRTFVTTPVGSSEVAGYYALAAGSVRAGTMPGRVRRNMPDPIPVVVLARLAVSADHQKAGLGISLLQDAVVRSVAAATSVGMRAMIIHALPGAGGFYERLGFVEAPPGSLTYVATIADMMRTLHCEDDLN